LKVLLDLNALLDVIQERELHYAASAAVLSRIASGEIEGAVAAHALTTIHYIVAKFSDRERALEAVDWLLGAMEIVPESRETFLRARGLGMGDFEDAVVAAAAEQAGCDQVVTRNVGDFDDSPVPAISPGELEATLTEPEPEAPE
jgi:predicted nucleic acid-binding protein